jgi:hypothetical protein
LTARLAGVGKGSHEDAGDLPGSNIAPGVSKTALMNIFLPHRTRES